MSTWKDILSPVPNDEQRIWLRRYPQATPAAFGTWLNGLAGVQAGPWGWEIEFNHIAAWRPLSGAPPDYPLADPPDKRWRDIFWYPPEEEESGYVRRWDQDCVAVRCVWDGTARAFNIPGSSLYIPWYHIYKWKPV